jgi:hypothetical protein
MIHLALNGTLVIVTPEKEEFEKWICESKFFGFRCEREKKNERNFHIHKKTPVQWKKKDPQLIFSLRVFSSLAIEFTASVLLSSHFRQHKRKANGDFCENINTSLRGDGCYCGRGECRTDHNHLKGMKLVVIDRDAANRIVKKYKTLRLSSLTPKDCRGFPSATLCAGHRKSLHQHIDRLRQGMQSICDSLHCLSEDSREVILTRALFEGNWLMGNNNSKPSFFSSCIK